jgi:hypothetical protein
MRRAAVLERKSASLARRLFAVAAASLKTISFVPIAMAKALIRKQSSQQAPPILAMKRGEVFAFRIVILKIS